VTEDCHRAKQPTLQSVFKQLIFSQIIHYQFVARVWIIQIDPGQNRKVLLINKLQNILIQMIQLIHLFWIKKTISCFKSNLSALLRL